MLIAHCQRVPLAASWGNALVMYPVAPLAALGGNDLGAPAGPSTVRGPECRGQAVLRRCRRPVIPGGYEDAVDDRDLVDTPRDRQHRSAKSSRH